jgi:hypothetical protein
MHAYKSGVCVLKQCIGPETDIFSRIDATFENFNFLSRCCKVLRSCIKYSTSVVVKIQLNKLIMQLYLVILCYMILDTFWFRPNHLQEAEYKVNCYQYV